MPNAKEEKPNCIANEAQQCYSHGSLMDGCTGLTEDRQMTWVLAIRYRVRVVFLLRSLLFCL
jgi:hypothetical protein